MKTSIRRLKSKQQHGCYYCRNEDGVKIRAWWRSSCFNKCACDFHKEKLEAFESRKVDPSYKTEAEFQIGL